MKKFFSSFILSVIVAGFLLAGWHMLSAQAAARTFAVACPNKTQDGKGYICDINVGDVLTINGYPKLTNNEPIGRADVRYQWLYNSTGPIITGGISDGATLGNNTDTFFEEITNRGFSRIIFTAGSDEIKGGILTLKVFYNNQVQSTVFTINQKCGDPYLKYAVAEVSTGNADSQKSTAEVLQTCRTEYKLQNGLFHNIWQ